MTEPKLNAAPWLVRLFLRLGLAAAAMIVVLVFVPQTRPYVPVVLSLVLPGPSEPERAGAPVRRSGPADALVVVSRQAINEAAQRRDFDDALWSYAWVGLLEQEFGSPAVLDLDELQTGHLEGRRVVVFTRSSTLLEARNDLVEAALRLARGGAAVILELPGADWSPLSGVVLSDAVVNPAGRVWRGQPLELRDLPGTLAGAPLGKDLASLREMPLMTWLKMGLMHDVPVVGLGSLSGQPALYVRREGRGAVLTLGFDLGCQLQALQQGVPAGPGWAVPERAGLIPGIPETQDLVVGPTMLDNPIPFADLLEVWLADMAEDAAGPLPGWWRFPFAYDGVAAVSHDEEERGLEGFQALLPLVRSLEIQPTVFVLTGENLAKRWPSRAEDLELHWNRFMSGEWPPYRWPSLSRQIQDLEAVRGQRPRLNRIHFLSWGRDYTQPFRQMAAAGLELDSTYGPNRGRGYLFGTSLPFRVLDENGLPLPLREWPFVAQEDWGGVDAGFTRKLLEDSQRSWHQAPQVLLHPHKWVTTQEGRGYLEHFVTTARQRQHWVVSMADYHQFVQMREKAQVRSSFQEGRLAADLEAPGPGLGLRLPDGLVEIRLDGRPARTRRIRLGDRPRLLVEVPAGRHRLEAREASADRQEARTAPAAPEP